MSADSLEVHPPIHSKGLRKNKESRDQVRPMISKPTILDTQQRRIPFQTARRTYETASRRLENTNPSLRPLSYRIHSVVHPKSSSAASLTYPGFSRASSGKENQASGYKSSLVSSKPHAPLSFQLPPPTSLRSPPAKKLARPNAIYYSHRITNHGLPASSFLNTAPIEPFQYPPPPPTDPPPQSSNKRRYETSGYEGPGVASDEVLKATRQEDTTIRKAQGHKPPSRSHGRSYSTSYAEPRTVTLKDLDRYRVETHTMVSSLGSRIGSLENTVAAALPIVAEARLIWMENTVVNTPTKLGTSRRALCEYYGHPKYTAYTDRIRARAYCLGLNPSDLKYLQGRLSSLSDQSSKGDSLLICPLGGRNAAGDKTMVDAYSRESKHGTYARRIWRVCYERAYSVDENWSVPLPVSDNSGLVDKIKGWLNSGE